ncbi:MAG: MFS transporter [Nitrospira sp.]
MSHSSIRTYLTPRLGIMLPLGFASGLPLALTGGTLQAWLTEAGLDLTTIGLFAYVGLPYTLKFLWAPVMDRIVPPWLGRRRGWMIVTQSGLALALAVMAVIGPAEGAQVFAALALAVAFLSASQDIVFDAYRTDVLKPEERGLGAATWVMGYRIAMIASGSLALILASRLNWSAAYLCMAALMALGVVTILVSPEPEDAQVAPKSMAEAVWGPLTEFLSRPMAVALLGLIVLYKLGDAFAGALTTSFLLRGMQFSFGGYRGGPRVRHGSHDPGGIYRRWVDAATRVVSFTLHIRHPTGPVEPVVHVVGLGGEELCRDGVCSGSRKSDRRHGHSRLRSAGHVALQSSLYRDPVCAAVIR